MISGDAGNTAYETGLGTGVRLKDEDEEWKFEGKEDW